VTKFIKDKGVKVRVESDGRRWVTLGRKPDEATKQYLRSMEDCGIWVSSEAPTLRGLIPEEIVAKVRRLYLQAPLRPDDGQFISNMRALESLVADPPLALDFGKLVNLRELRAQWHPSWADTLSESVIEKLLVQGLRKVVDLRVLANAENLTELEIVQSSIASLAGVQRLRSLRVFCVSYVPLMEDIAHLSKLPHLERVEFESCSRISSYAPLAQVANLRALKLTKCAPVPSLRLFRNLKRLDFISFVNTPILDNDTEVLTQFPALTYAGFLDKRGYNAKFATIDAVLSQRERGGKKGKQ
jgi:hypothetical protein